MHIVHVIVNILLTPAAWIKAFFLEWAHNNLATVQSAIIYCAILIFTLLLIIYLMQWPYIMREQQDYENEKDSENNENDLADVSPSEAKDIQRVVLLIGLLGSIATVSVYRVHPYKHTSTIVGGTYLGTQISDQELLHGKFVHDMLIEVPGKKQTVVAVNKRQLHHWTNWLILQRNDQVKVAYRFTKPRYFLPKRSMRKVSVKPTDFLQLKKSDLKPIKTPTQPITLKQYAKHHNNSLN